MPRPVSDQIASRLVRNQVDVLRYSAGVQRDVLELLTRLRADLVSELAQVDPMGVTRTAYRQARLETLLDNVQGVISTAYRNASKVAGQDLSALAQSQAQAIVGIVNQSVGANLISFAYTKEQLAAISSKVLIEGAPSAEWWAGQSDALQGAFARQMRMGMARGESIQEMTKRIVDTMEVSRKQAEILVRTSAIATANAAHMDAYRANADIVKGIQWLSTLDTRTTQICRGLDGLTWDLDGNPLDGNNHAYPGHSAHWGCRSTQLPLTKSWEELAKEAGGDTKVARALDQMDPGQRASMDGAVAGNLTYEDWLRGQPEAVQKEVLGPGKFETWKKDPRQGGGLTLTEMLDQRGNPLTLAELQAKATAGGEVAQATGTDAAKVLRDTLTRYEGEADMVNRMAKTAGEPFTSLTEEQLVAINQYTRGAYVQVNEELWTGGMKIDPWTTHSQETYQAISELTKQGLQRLPPTQGTVWRGEPAISGWTDTLKPGAVVDVKGFWSSSAGKHQAFEEKTLWMLKSKTGRNVAPLSAYEVRESEVLFPPGTKWRITSVEKLANGRRLVAAEEL